MGYSSTEQFDLYLVLLITNSLSLAGSLFIITIFTSFASIRSYAFKLVFYMSIADAIRSIGFLIPPSPEPSCIAQAVLTNFGSLSGVIWTSIIAFSIYSVVVLETENIQSYEKFMILIGYVLPFCVSMLPFTTNSYGYAQGWCWLKGDAFEILWGMAAFYVVVFIAIVFNAVMYYKVIQELKEDIGYLVGSQHDISEKRTVHTRFSFYPLIMVVCYLPVLIKRILEIAALDSSFGLAVVAAVSMSIVGVLNAVVYGITDSVKELICKPFNRSRSTFSRGFTTNDGLVNEVNEDIFTID